MNRAVFLDRDGVINRKPPEGEYIVNRRELVLLPGVPDAVRELQHAGFLVIVVTNQSGVARGKIDLDELHAIHQRMRELFLASEVSISDIYVCPHEGDCTCRKPAPGMLLRAAQEHGVDLQTSWVVGDSLRDIEAGKRAGCQTIWIIDGAAEQQCDWRPNLCAKDLPEAARLILKANEAAFGERKRRRGMG